MNRRQKEILNAQLKSEKAILAQLKEEYRAALQEINEKIKLFQADIQQKQDALALIKDEGQRALVKSEIQSKIYQRNYQKALKGQISAILDKMNSNQYDKIRDYISECYDDGYVATMYDLHGQGIPIITPIDQTQVVKAVSNDTKLSEPLYTALGYHVDTLKKSVVNEISRGIAVAMSWADIARNIEKRSGVTMNKAYRIARTEGHRVQNQAAMDAQYKAKDAGADVVKQWCATLDGRTRPHHRQLDGQLRELDEPFDINGRRGMYPGGFGVAAEDINCRCRLLQRARWALDEDELETLKQRAEYFGLDKTEDFENFKRKYLAIEREESKPKYEHPETVINSEVLKSAEYRRKFDRISDNPAANRQLWQYAKEILEHRTGTKYEDIAFVDVVTGKGKIMTNYNVERTAKPSKAMFKMLRDSTPNTIIAIHNHPGSGVPSLADINAYLQRKYYKGVVVCHNGDVYVYQVDISKYNNVMAHFALDNLDLNGYTDDVKRQLIDAGISMEVIVGDS